MDYSLANPPKARWEMEARHADGMSLPPWTRDESDHEDYDVAVMNDVARRNRRKIRRRTKRDETQELPTNPNVQLSPPSSKPAIRKRQRYDMPGNSLRESTVESYSQTATEVASATASGYPKETENYASTKTTEPTTSSQYATKTTAPTTTSQYATKTASKSKTASPTADSTANGDPYESGSDSESDGLSDSASDSDYDEAQNETVSSVPSSSADAALSGSRQAELVSSNLECRRITVIDSVPSVMAPTLINLLHMLTSSSLGTQMAAYTLTSIKSCSQSDLSVSSPECHCNCLVD